MTSPGPGAYNTGATSVGTSPTLIATTVGTDSGGMLVQNNGSVTVYLGGATVASSGANLGFALAASSSVLVPTVGGPPNALYGVTGSSTATVVVLFSSGA
jgi:hypothetical protein